MSWRQDLGLLVAREVPVTTLDGAYVLSLSLSLFFNKRDQSG
jgi:hypothetical protein